MSETQEFTPQEIEALKIKADRYDKIRKITNRVLVGTGVVAGMAIVGITMVNKNNDDSTEVIVDDDEVIIDDEVENKVTNDDEDGSESEIEVEIVDN